MGFSVKTGACRILVPLRYSHIVRNSLGQSENITSDTDSVSDVIFSDCPSEYLYHNIECLMCIANVAVCDALLSSNNILMNYLSKFMSSIGSTYM